MLENTRVADLTPIAGCSAMQTLALDNTPRVRHTLPLAGMTNLFMLLMRDTQVTDLSPIQGLNIALISTEHG